MFFSVGKEKVISQLNFKIEERNALHYSAHRKRVLFPSGVPLGGLLLIIKQEHQ